MKTSTPTKEQQNDRKWHIVDADGKILGRLATEVAQLLRGKHKPTFTPHMDMGDHVIVINASKVKVTGAKSDQKHYYRHSGVPGNLKAIPLSRMLEKHPERLLESAIKGMLPKNKLRDKMIKKLHVYKDAEHKHEAQQPQPFEIA